MVKDRDVQDLLNTGVWTTRRAKSPRPSNIFRAEPSYRLDPLEPDDKSKVPRTFAHFSYSHFPPAPIVEDEEASVAKESNGSVVSLNDEEPKCRGTVDQFPIILPVPEYNAERRFVLVAPPETEEDIRFDDLGSRRSGPSDNSKYAANSKVQLDPNAHRDEAPPLERRRSRVDLPRIETDARKHVPPRPSSHNLRSRSATCLDQGQRDASPRDYFSARPDSGRPAGEAFLTPVVKHATKGRDRAYWNFGAGGDGSGQKDPSLQQKPQSADRKGLDGYAKLSHTAGPGVQRRLHSDMEVPQLRKTVERHSSYRDETHSRARTGPLSPSLERKRSPPRLSRRETSPARSRTESLKFNRSRASYQGHSSPTVLEDSSDECRDHKSHRHRRERRRSTVIHDERSAFLSPAGPRPPTISKPRSKPPSPLPSPKSSQERFPDSKVQPDPRGSTIFNVAKDKRRNEIEHPVSPTSSASSSSPQSRSRLRADDRASDLGRPRASSRTPSIKSNASSTKPVNFLPALSAALLPTAIHSDDRKRQMMPPTPNWSRQGSWENFTQPAPCGEPEDIHVHHQNTPLTPRHSANHSEQSGPSVVSYRRYSQDVSSGTPSGFPDCPRKRPRSGHVDWYTLPKYDNFNICPSCYEHIFYPTMYRDLFVLAPTRSRDREIACDLGTSPWYRIAWLMTRKYRRTDLRLLQGIADVSLRHKVPCYGAVRVTRIWYSILDPETRRCISNFKICSPCADSVQVLFPSLTGVFVPLDRLAEPRSGQCSLHFAPNRTRFVTYFDILEDTHDRAMAKNSAPNMQRLVERIDSWAGIEECPKDESRRHVSWYTMAHIPEMTVCEECFLDVVYPELVVDASAIASGAADASHSVNSVVRNFYHKPQMVKSATVCQMASPWMRDLFRRACRRDDGLEYLDAKVRDRLGSM